MARTSLARVLNEANLRVVLPRSKDFEAGNNLTVEVYPVVGRLSETEIKLEAIELGPGTAPMATFLMA